VTTAEVLRTTSNQRNQRPSDRPVQLVRCGNSHRRTLSLQQSSAATRQRRGQRDDPEVLDSDAGEQEME